jgi:zinc protease
MTTLRKSAIAAAAALLVAATGVAQVRDYRDIKTPPLRTIKVQQPKRIQLANGMVIFLQEDHELPLISGAANIRGGDRDVPADKAGLSAIVSQAWRTGGTTTRTGDELDDMLEARAARVETAGDDDSTSVSINVLKQDFDAVFPIFIDVLRNPAFRQEKIDLAKTQMNTVISRRNDEPGSIVGREAAKLGFGKDSPYTRQAEYATVASITRDDLLAFHKRFVHPNNIILGLVGDFDSAAMERRLRATFESWPRGQQAPPPAVGGTAAKPGVYFITKEDVNQASIAVLHPGAPMRSDPEYPAIVVMNEILSGGFSGRLMNQLRSQMGLTYGVGGGIITEWDHPGLVRVGLATKSGTMMQALEAVRQQLSDLHTKPFTSDELALAKESILNAYVFERDSKAKVLNQRVLLEFYGYPAEFFDQYIAGIERVSAEDVARVAKRYVRPDQVAILVVGNPKDFDKPLTTIGTVTPIDITIPEPGARPAAAAIPTQSTPEGTALLKKIQDFVGGKAALDAVKAMHVVTTATLTAPQGEMQMDTDAIVVFPESRRATLKMPMGEMTMVLTPEASFAITPMGTRDLPQSQRDALRAENRQEIVMIAKYPERYTVTAGGTEKVGNVDGQVLQVSFDGETVRFVIDPATGKPLRKIARGRGPMAQGDQITDYTEYKTFGGITVPTAFTVTSNGKTVATGKLTTLEVNPAVDAKIWEKPAA